MPIIYFDLSLATKLNLKMSYYLLSFLYLIIQTCSLSDSDVNIETLV